MAFDPRAIHIYTDGSCYRNPGGSSGCAAIVHYPDDMLRLDEQIIDFGCAESSNNRMELLACIQSLRWIRHNEPWPNVTRVQIITDSRYVKDNLFRAQNWQRNRWRNLHGEPKANSDLWKQLLYARARVRTVVHFECTLGKKSQILRTIDKAAKAAAQRGGTGSDRGFRGGTVARSMVPGSASRFCANGQTAIIRPYRKNLMSKAEEKVRFDVFSQLENAFVQSCYAFATCSVAAELHRNHTYCVRFNDCPKYPQILEVVEEVAVEVS